MSPWRNMARAISNPRKACAALAAGIYFLWAALGSAQTASPLTANDSEEGVPEVRILSADEMGPQSAALISSRHAEIANDAEFYGYDMSEGAWLQQQVLCPGVPNSLLMRYSETAPNGDVSMLTAIVPRTQGPVRIIPVLYRGQGAEQLFGSSSTERELINQLAAHLQESGKSDAANSEQVARWKTLVYCLAAVAGAEPVSKSATSSVEAVRTNTIQPIFELSSSGKVRSIAFNFIESNQVMQAFEIVFDRQMHVTSITQSVTPMRVPTTVQDSILKSRPIPSSR